MEFCAIPDAHIRKFIEQCYLTDQNSLAITLTNGVTVIGRIPGKTWRGGSGFVSASEQCFPKDGHLRLRYDAVFNEHSIFVPFNRIAGIHLLSYEQEQVKSPTDRFGSAYDKGSVHENLFLELLTRAQEYGFPIERELRNYMLTMGESFDWGKVTFSNDAPVYSDWTYLQRVSGGINSIGVGIPVASISAGWDRSLWSMFRKKVAQRETDFESVCTNQEVVMEGFVSFINRKIGNTKVHEEQLEMEGAHWAAAAISDRRIATTSELKNSPWALAYFRLDGFMFPKELWEILEQPVKVFAEVVPASMSTEMGPLTCYLKARCGAYLKDT